MKSIFELFRYKPYPSINETGASKLDLFPKIPVLNQDVFVGIEVEIENCKSWIDQYAIWNVREDGSLRKSGHEFVSVPLKGNYISHALNYLFANLNQSINFSLRTSIHIHVDIQRLTVQQLNGFLLTYLAVEPLLYKFIGKDRDKNIFCVPLYETELPVNLVKTLENNITSISMDNMRYAGLNLDAIRKFGTLEFRQLYGTSEIPLIMDWINLIMSMYNYGTKVPFNEVVSRITKLNTNSFYISFINDIFGSLADKLDLTAVKFDMERGVKSVKASLIKNTALSYILSGTTVASDAIVWLKKNQVSSKPKPQTLDWTNVPPLAFDIIPATGQIFYTRDQN